MSTSGESRPAPNKIATKAVAADGPKPDESGSGGKASGDKASGGKGSGGSGSGGSGSGGGRSGAGRAGAAGRSGVSGGRGGARGGSAARTGGSVRRGVSVRSGGKGRKSVGPVRVAQTRDWGPIAMYIGAGVVTLLIIGFAAFALFRQGHQPSWQDRAAAIPGINNDLQTHPEWFVVGAGGNHKNGVLTYPTNPPVGGTHNPMWQNCMGDVYTAEIPKEQATHSLEHGAVWVTYRPDLPADQIATLASKVEGRSFMLMSPYPGLDSPISLQAWGYQLKVDNAGDRRIDDFINALRQNASQEPQAGCSGGITDPGTKPLDLPGSEG